MSYPELDPRFNCGPEHFFLKMWIRDSTWAKFKSSIVTVGRNSPSNHFWRRILPVPRPCSRRRPRSWTCYCRSCCMQISCHLKTLKMDDRISGMPVIDGQISGIRQWISDQISGQISGIKFSFQLLYILTLVYLSIK